MSSTSHVIEIIFRVSGQQQVIAPLQSITKQTTSVTKATTESSKAYTEYTGVVNKTRTGALSFATAQTGVVTSVKSLGKELPTVTKGANQLSTTHTKLSTSTTKTASSMGGLAAKFRENRGLVFGSVGMIAAGVEAIGMLTMFTSASDKLSQAQAKVNELEDQGKTKTAAYRDAVQAANEAQKGFNYVMRNTILSFFDLLPFSLMFINSLINMKAKTAEAAVSVAQLATSNNLLATSHTTQLSPAFAAFTTQLNTHKTATDVARTNLDLMRADLVKLTQPFKDAGTAVKNFVTKAISYFKNLPSGFAGIQKAFTDLGAKMMVGLTKIGKGFKALGVAIVGELKKIAIAMMSNPLLLFLTAISIAIGALIFDLGGFRTRLNEVGIALGNAVPALKPILDFLGMIGQQLGNLGAWITGNENLAKSFDKVKAAVAEARLQTDPLLLSMKEVLDVGDQFQNFGNISVEIDRVKNAIANLTETTDYSGQKIVEGLGVVGNQFEILNADIVDKNIPEIKTALDEWHQAMKLAEDKTLTLAQRQAILNAALKKVLDAILGVQKEKQADIKSTEEITKKTTALTDQQVALNEILKDEEAELGKLDDQYLKNAQTVGDWITDYGTGYKITQQFKNELLEHAGALDLLTDKIVQNDDSSINWDATLKNLSKSTKELGDQADKTFGTYLAKLTNLGTKALPDIQSAINVIKEDNAELGEMLQKMLDEWLDNMIPVAGQYYVINEAQQEEQTELEKSNEKIAERIEKLGEAIDLEGLSIEQKEDYLTLLEDEEKETDKVTQELRKQAIQRGLGKEVMKMSNDELREYIKTHQLEYNVLEESQKIYDNMINTRTEDTNQIKAQEAALKRWIAENKINTYNMELSAAGMQSLINLHDDLKTSQQSATDAVTIWYQTQVNNRQTEVDTMDALIQLSEAIGVTIPKAILDKGVEAVKEFILQSKNLGDTVEEQTKRAKDAFNDLASGTKSALSSMIEEDLLEGKFDDVEEALEDIEKSVLDLDSAQAIIDVLINKTDFEDDVQTLREVISQNFQGMVGDSVAAADEVIAVWTTGLRDELGAEAEPTIAVINNMWNLVKKENPQLKGAELINAFIEAISSDPSLLKQAIDLGIINPTDEAFSQILGIGEKGGKDVKEGIKTGLTGGTLIENEMQTYIIDPMTGKLKEVPYAAETELQPLEGIFSQAFLNASNQGGIQLAALVVFVHTKMSSMSTSVKTYSDSMSVNWSTGITAMKDAMPPLDTAINKTHGEMSNMSTSVATYSESMGTNIDTFSSEAVTDFETLGTAIDTFKTDAVTDFEAVVTEGIDPLNTKFTDMEEQASDSTTNTSAYFNTMRESVVSNLGRIMDEIDDLIEKMEELEQAAKDAAKAQSKVDGGGGGGSTESAMNSIFRAQHGKRFVIDKPTRIPVRGGVASVSEYFKPEELIIRPLTDPNKINEQNISNNYLTQNRNIYNRQDLSDVNTMKSGLTNVSGSNAINVHVRGDIYQEIKTMDGQLIKRQIAPLIFENASSVTSR